MRKGWHYCMHCQGTGMCKNVILGIRMVLGIIPIPIKASDASCLSAAGVNPVKYKDLAVKCSICKGKGYVWLDPEGDKIAEPKN